MQRSLVTDLHAQFAQVSAEKGRVRVFARREADVPAEQLAVAVGDVELALAPVSLDGADRLATFRDPLAVAPTLDEAAGYALDVDAMDDWRLPGFPTAQVHVIKPHSQVRVPLVRDYVVPAGAPAIAFGAGLAVHRARADLVVTASAANRDGEREWVVPFDAAFMGGRSADLYRWVAQEVGTFARQVRLDVDLVYRRAEGDLSAGNPFLFVAAPEIRYGASDSLHEPVVVRGTPGEVDRVLEAQLSPSAIGRGAAIALVLGEDRLELVARNDPAFTLEKDFGHSVMIDASERTRALLYLDQEPAAALTLVEGQNFLRLPQRFLTGAFVLVELRDPSGCQVWFQTYVMARRQLTWTEALQREQAKRIAPHLFVQSEFRYRGLRAHLADPRSAPILDQLPRAIETLEAGYEGVSPWPMRFPPVEDPDVTVVVPVHDKFAVTFSCLCALLLAHNQARFEVVLVDDASTDETARIEEWVEGLVVVRNDEPKRFIGACNAGVAAGRGRFVALLNNDTEPTVGWLDALIAALERFPRAGLAGAKLVFPDGRLQEAGSIVWGNGDPTNYGWGENPWEPRFSYARRVDYVSGAALLTTRAIWDEVGGLSEYLEPMYFEDTDFAFKVRDAGYTTWFTPDAVVFHWEGMTSGKEVTGGFKRFMEVNRPKFKRRWAKAFRGNGDEGVAPDLPKDRGIAGRVLFIDYTTPRPQHDAGSYAAVQEIRLVQALGYKVTFLPTDLAHFASYTEELQAMGVEVVYAPFFLSVAEFIDARGREFDAIYITRYHVAANLLDQLRRVAPHAKIMLNNADLHFLRELRAALAADDPARVEAAVALREAELQVMRDVDVVLSYNEVEHAVIQSHTAGAVRVMKCPWVVAVPESVPPLEERRDMSFLGSFRHPPNIEGLRWFVQTVMPLLEKHDPSLALAIYGSAMGDDVKALASERVRPLGFVEDVADAYDRHRIFVAPLLSGAGIKGKVVAALAHGIPCVLTPTAAEATGARDRVDCFIASTSDEWAEAILALARDDALWRRMSESARDLVAHRFSFARGLEDMRAAFEAVDLFAVMD